MNGPPDPNAKIDVLIRSFLFLTGWGGLALGAMFVWWAMVWTAMYWPPLTPAARFDKLLGDCTLNPVPFCGCFLWFELASLLCVRAVLARDVLSPRHLAWHVAAASLLAVVVMALPALPYLFQPVRA